MNPALLAVLEAGWEAVKAIISTIEQAKAGTITPEEALAQIPTMNAELASDDAATAAAEAAKFPTP